LVEAQAVFLNGTPVMLNMKTVGRNLVDKKTFQLAAHQPGTMCAVEFAK
jgi:hypothetical protein